MGNMVTNAYAKSGYDRLRIGKGLGFRKSDKKKTKKKLMKKKNNNNNVRSHWEPPFRVQKLVGWITVHRISTSGREIS